jgi:hypothetical protein
MAVAVYDELRAHGIDPNYAWCSVRDFGLMAWIGQAIGENTADVRKDHQVSEILKHFPDTGMVLVATTVYQSPDDYQSYPGEESKTLKEWVVELVDNNSQRYRWQSDLEITNLGSLEECIREILYGDDCHLRAFETQAKYDKRVKEEERRRLEKAAAKIAADNDVRVDSIGFIKACYRIIDRQQFYREGMAEDRLCIGYGVTADQYFDELNESRSDTNHVREILDWLSENCPLLWAQYQESVKDGSFDQYDGEDE